MTKKRLATVWLDGCSGCHMSFLDMDEALIEIAQVADVVCSPYVDTKEFPRDVDVTLVEGAVSSTEDLEKLHRVRERTRVLVSFGDCAVNSNVPSMRNPFGVGPLLSHVYIEKADNNKLIPTEVVPALLPKSRPVHEFVAVDLFIPGCPPPPAVIRYAVGELLEGRKPDLAQMARFGQ